MYYQPIAGDDDELSIIVTQPAAHRDDDGGHFIQSPAYVSMNRWVAFVIMSFALAYNAGNYNQEANKLLGRLLDQFNKSRNTISDNLPTSH